MTGDDGGSRPNPGGTTPASLAELRRDDRRRPIALSAAVLVGLGAASVHWLGLFLAGALLGLVSESVPRAVLSGVAFGLTVVATPVLLNPVVGAGEFLALTPVSYVTVAAGLLAPTWGSLVRAVV